MFSMPTFDGMPVIDLRDNTGDVVFIDYAERPQESSVTFSASSRLSTRESIAIEGAVNRLADSLIEKGYFATHGEALAFARQNGSKLSRQLDPEPIRATADLREKISRVAEARLAADPDLDVMETYSEVEARFLHHLRRR